MNTLIALEEIMKLNKDAPIPQTETAIDAAPSLDDLRSMMKDPRYWKDGDRDQAYINKVSNLYFCKVLDYEKIRTANHN